MRATGGSTVYEFVAFRVDDEEATVGVWLVGRRVLLVEIESPTAGAEAVDVALFILVCGAAALARRSSRIPWAAALTGPLGVSMEKIITLSLSLKHFTL